MNKFKQAREGLERVVELTKEHTPNVDELHLVLGHYIGKAMSALTDAERMVWREMDTAPHGQWILISAYGSVCQACWNANGYWTTFADNRIQPTTAEKWMPLPETKGLEDE